MNIKPDTKFGGSIPEKIVQDIAEQFQHRLVYLKEQYPERNYTYRAISEIIGGGKAWVNDFFLKKFTDIRVSSLHRIATALGCEIRFVLVPKETISVQLSIEDVLVDPSNE